MAAGRGGTVTGDERADYRRHDPRHDKTERGAGYPVRRAGGTGVLGL
jgi:hypothetical protein